MFKHLWISLIYLRTCFLRITYRYEWICAIKCYITSLCASSIALIHRCVFYAIARDYARIHRCNSNNMHFIHFQCECACRICASSYDFIILVLNRHSACALAISYLQVRPLKSYICVCVCLNIFRKCVKCNNLCFLQS